MSSRATSRPFRAALVGLCALALSGLSSGTALAGPGGTNGNGGHGPAARSAPPGSLPPPAPVAPRRASDGPHSPVGRVPAPPTMVQHQGVTIREVDLGDVDLGDRPGQFRSPVRGLLVTPAIPRGKAPLVVFSHLRHAACLGEVYAYPCPDGDELRLDRGMLWLAQSLAKEGYAVLVPDLSPLFVGGRLDREYDQYAGWDTVVRPLRDAVVAAAQGQRTAWGAGLGGAIDTRRVWLVAHSRSAQVAGLAVRAWAGSSTPVAGVLAYGPVYDVPDERGRFTPMLPDVPYLAVIGDRDEDVHLAGVQWLTEHLGTWRTSMAAAAVVPGLGHYAVNRELSSRLLDDRVGCDARCPDAADHEGFLLAVTSEWLSAMARGRPTKLPVRATSPLPDALGGRSARWLALTPHARPVPFLAGVSGRLGLVGTGGAARFCRYPDPDLLRRPSDACAEPAAGTSATVSRVAQVVLSPSGGVRLTTDATGVQSVVLQVSPPGDRPDRGPGSPVRVTVRTASGRTADVDVPATDPALRDRATRLGPGQYAIGTVRLRLPAWVAGQKVTAVELTGGTATSRLDLRAVELVSR